MALTILEGCIGCDICVPECPNEAITQGEDSYSIDPARCTECIGHYTEPQCVQNCPVDCISADPNRQESEDQLWAKYEHLTGKQRH